MQTRPLSPHETGGEKLKLDEKSQFNRDAKEFLPMSKLNAEAPEFVPGKAKMSPTFAAIQGRGVCESSPLSKLQRNIITLIRTSGPNGLLTDEIPDKYKEKFGGSVGDVDLSTVLDSLSQYIHVMLAAKADNTAKADSAEHVPAQFSLGYHKGKRVVDQYIYTMGEGVEKFREMIVKVIQEFCVRNMTRSDHPLTLATKGLLPAGANGIVRPTGLALSLFAAEWERYFSGTEDFKSLREKYNVQKLMPFLLGIPELDVVGTHPEVRVRMRDMDSCLEEAEKRARTCSPEEISAMQSGGSTEKIDFTDNLSQPRKISCEPSERKSADACHPFFNEQSFHAFQQQQAAIAAHYQGLRTPAHEQAMAQAHMAAMKFHYHQQMMQAAAATMAQSHVAAGGPSIPITSEFFPTSSSDYPSSIFAGRQPRKPREEASQFPPLPPTNSSAYNPLAAKMQLMKSVNVSRNLSSCSVSRPSASVPSLPHSKGSSPGVSAAQNASKSVCVTPNLVSATEKDKGGNSSAANSASKGGFFGVRTPLKSGGLKLTPVASEAPVQAMAQSPPAGEKVDIEITGAQLADLARLGIGLFVNNGPPEGLSFPLLGGPALCQGGPEDTTASATPVLLSVNPSPSESQFLSKSGVVKAGALGLEAKAEQPTAERGGAPLLPFVEPLNADEQSASNCLQEMIKLMKEPLNGQAPDPNLLADLAHVLGNSATLLGHQPSQNPPAADGPAPADQDSEATAKMLMNLLQQQGPPQAFEPTIPLFDVGSGADVLSENIMSSFLGQLVQGEGQEAPPPSGQDLSVSPELKFDAEAVNKLIQEPSASPPDLAPTASNGEYDRLTMLLVRAQMKHQLQEPPPELKTLKTAFDPQYLKMKRPAAKTPVSVEGPMDK